MFSVDRVQISTYVPIYLECLYPYPYLSDSDEDYMYDTHLRTNHKLFYSVLYLNHGELVCIISGHMISWVYVYTDTYGVQSKIKRPWSSRLVPPTFPRSLLLTEY